MAEEILQSCHPNAVRNVKYYLTITQTRWEQVTIAATCTANFVISLTPSPCSHCDVAGGLMYKDSY